MSATAWTADYAQHCVGLLNGAPSQVEPDLRPDAADEGLSDETLVLLAREALDAAARDVAVEAVRAIALPTPHGRAVVAAIEAAATSDEAKWHDALQLAVDHGFPLIAVDALEGIGAAAATAENWAGALRLFGAAQRLRDECGYRWRFRFEQHALDSARTAAREALSQGEADAAESQGRGLDWRDAAGQAPRNRDRWASRFCS